MEQLACNLRSLALSKLMWSASLFTAVRIANELYKAVPALEVALLISQRIKGWKDSLHSYVVGFTPDTGDGEWWRQWDIY